MLGRHVFYALVLVKVEVRFKSVQISRFLHCLCGVFSVGSSRANGAFKVQRTRYTRSEEKRALEHGSGTSWIRTNHKPIAAED